MARTESNMLDLGTKAPDFILPDVVSGKELHFNALEGFAGYVIYFICNHCPYVIHVNPELIRIAKEYQKKNVAFVAISSNDAETYPQDGPEKMKEHAEALQYPFPYLYDERQEVAKSYEAACTPDIYLFDAHKELVYRGRIDESRPNSEVPLTGKDLRAALDALLSELPIDPVQYPSVGCNIKWKKAE